MQILNRSALNEINMGSTIIIMKFIHRLHVVVTASSVVGICHMGTLRCDIQNMCIHYISRLM